MCIKMWWLFFLPLVHSMRYDWAYMHEAGAQQLCNVVDEYAAHFPCEECRLHFNDLLDTHPFQLEDVQTDDDAGVWSWLTHNIVNKRIGKKWQPFSIMNQYSVK